MRDVDLSMLGRPPKEYAQYATAVRKEYADIPDAVFSEARARILAVFLDMASRDELFTSNWFRERSYNRQASENLASEISSLRSQG
jgi:predicted metal-dependent HD superfamily phosphohydrolase